MSINVTEYANKGLASAAAKRKGMKEGEYDVRQNKAGKWFIADLNTPLFNAKIRDRSKVDGAVGIVWDIAAKMYETAGVARKDIIAACVDAGVNIHTAKTQIQRYREAAGMVKARG